MTKKCLFITLVWLFAATSWFDLAAGRDEKLRIRSGRTIFHIVGMIPYPGPIFVSEYTPSLKEYLDKEVGSLFDPPINFSLGYQDAYDISPFDNSVEKPDFVFTTPNMAGCLEAEFRHIPLLTVRSGVAGLNRYGGVVYVRADREDLQHITDLRDKVVTASNFNLCQFQWRVFEQRGISLMADTAQVRFSAKGEELLIADVLEGNSDAAFTRTDIIEAQPPAVRKKLRILEPLANLTVDGVPFPFQSTSELYPENALLAGEHVEWELQREVVGALLRLQASEGAPELQPAGIQGFQPALSYASSRDLFQQLGLMTMDPVLQRWRCLRADHIFDGLACPAGMFKRSRAEFEQSCQAQGTPCPEGYDCLCRPCKRGSEVEVRVFAEPEEEADSESWRRAQAEDGGVRGRGECSKMALCGVTRQRQNITYRLTDNKLRAPMRVEWRLRKASTVSSGEGRALVEADGSFNFEYELVLASLGTGVHILELLLDGTQVPSSPVLLEVKAALCSRARVANDEGICVCAAGFFSLGPSSCLSLSLLLVLLLALLSTAALLRAAWLCLHRDQLAADLDYARLRARILLLRRRLRIRPEDGWFLASEKGGWWWVWALVCGRSTHPLKTHSLLALANLSLLQKFDVEAVDYLATQLQMADDASMSLSHCTHPLAAAVTPSPPSPPASSIAGRDADSRLLWRLLSDLVLELSQQLLDPSREELEARWDRLPSSLSTLRRSASFLHSLFCSPKPASPGPIAPRSPPFRDDTASSILRMPAADARESFEFFRQHVARLQLWRHGDTFAQLKLLIQHDIDSLREQMDAVYSEMVCEDGGKELVDFWWQPPSAPDMPGPRAPAAGTTIQRQDHAEMELLQQRAHAPAQDADLEAGTGERGESQFVEQLHVRAALLDPGFQAHILRIFSSSTDSSSSSRPDVPAPPALGPHHVEHDTGCGGAGAEAHHPGPPAHAKDWSSSVQVVSGQIKAKARMLDKVREYGAELLLLPTDRRPAFPLTAQILDPVRASVVCRSPRAILEVANWLIHNQHHTGLPVVRSKNKFSVKDSAEYDGYRDLMLSVLYAGVGDLRIIGEIQLHDDRMYPLKMKMHRLYKVKRATCAESI